MNHLNWKWGETCPVSAPVAPATVIEIGDLLYLDSGKALPASSFAKSTDLAGTQAAFTPKFLGVAMQASPAGATSPIRVATCGTFEFTDDTSAGETEVLGTYVSADLNAAATHLQNRAVIKVSGAKTAIGRIVHLENVPAGKAYIAILSTIIKGGVAGSDPSHTTT